jgi:small-conductance mechanosensitive channel
VKKIAIALGVLALLAVFILYNAWRAAVEPVKSPPDALETGRAQLHSQLEQAEQSEGQAEKQAWNSVPELAQLAKWHEHRVERLAGNSQGGVIVAYDRDSIARLQQRIADLAEQAKAEASAAAQTQPQ